MELWLPRVIKMDWAWFIYLNQLNIYLCMQCVRRLQMLAPWWLVCSVCQATVDLLIDFLSWLGVFYRPGSCRPASGLSINMWVSQLMTGLWRWNNSTVKFIYIHEVNWNQLLSLLLNDVSVLSRNGLRLGWGGLFSFCLTVGVWNLVIIEPKVTYIECCQLVCFDLDTSWLKVITHPYIQSYQLTVTNGTKWAIPKNHTQLF